MINQEFSFKFPDVSRCVKVITHATFEGRSHNEQTYRNRSSKLE